MTTRNLQAGVVELFIYDFIGERGITSAAFVAELRAIRANKILLRVNSVGGDIFDGIAIRNALIEHPASIETHVDGIAASTASWIALAGSPVIMAQSSAMMIHEPFNVVMGDAATMRKQADVLDLFAAEIGKLYAAKAGGTPSEWRDRMRAETWYTAEEAVAAGLADEVAAVAQAAATWSAS